MKKQVFYLLAVAAMVAASCKGVVEEIAPQEPESKLVQRDFSAVVTKTALSGNQVVWQSGDEISVFAGGTAATGGSEYALKDYDSGNPSSNATFTGSIAEATDYYAVYPYLADNAYNGNATLTATVPVEQVITFGSFAPGAAVVVGKADVNYTFPFQNAVALLKVKLGTGMDGASRIEVSGNNNELIAGAFKATYSGGSFTFTDADSGTSKTVTLNIEDGTFQTDQDYYIAIRPTEFTKGLTAKVYFPQEGGAPDKVAVKTSEAAVTINAGQILTLGTFTGSSVWAPSLGYGDNETFTLGDKKYVSFNYGDSKVFPVANVDHIDVTGLAAGWSASFDSATSKVTVTAPAASPAGSYPPGPLGLKLVSSEGNEATPALNVRLYGIGSVEELKMADHIMQAESGFTVPTGTPAGTIDNYLVTNADNVQELFLTADLTLATSDLRSNAIAMHHNDYPINGNGRTVTYDDVTVTAWPSGFVQNLMNDVHDLNFTGSITNSASSVQIGALAARAYNPAVSEIKVTNVTSDVDITWDGSASDSQIGGLVGYMATGNKSITFKNCSVGGTIEMNGEVLNAGGIIGRGEGTGTDASAYTTFEDCTFTGNIVYRPDATQGRKTRIGGIVGNSERQLKVVNTTSNGRIDVYLNNKVFGKNSSWSAIGGFFGRSAAQATVTPAVYMDFYLDNCSTSTDIYVWGTNASEWTDAFQIRGYGLCKRSGPDASGNIAVTGGAAIHFDYYAGPEISASTTTSFAYGTTTNIPVTTGDLSEWTVSAVTPTGWSADVSHIKDASPYVAVTAPSQAAIQAGTAVGAGEISFTLTHESIGSCSASGTAPAVRLYGINSKDEFNAFKSAYGANNSNDITTPHYNDNYDDYLMDGVITLNTDLTITTSDLYSSYYVIKWLYDPLEGNCKTITFDNVASSGAVCGFFQGIKNNVSNLNFAGKMTVTNTAVQAAALASRGGYAFVGTSTGTTTVTNVNSSLQIVYSPTAQNGKAYIGGLVGCGGYVASVKQQFINCTVSGTIENNSYSPFALGGFVASSGQSGAKTVVDLNNCTFSGSIVYRYSTNSNGSRIGGFVGDDGRQTILNGCTFDGTISVYLNNSSLASNNYGIGGFVGRTTAPAADPHVMLCHIDNCTYSGTITAYDANSTQWIGTCIGSDVGYAVTTVDGVQVNSNISNYNFPATSVLTAASE